MALNDNWLTLAIQECLKIERLISRRERRAEIDCIASRITGDERGAPFLKAGEAALREALGPALDKADEMAEVDGGGHPSPAQAAAVALCERFGVEWRSLGVIESVST